MAVGAVFYQQIIRRVCQKIIEDRIRGPGSTAINTVEVRGGGEGDASYISTTRIDGNISGFRKIDLIEIDILTFGDAILRIFDHDLITGTRKTAEYIGGIPRGSTVNAVKTGGRIDRDSCSCGTGRLNKGHICFRKFYFVQIDRDIGGSAPQTVFNFEVICSGRKTFSVGGSPRNTAIKTVEIGNGIDGNASIISTGWRNCRVKRTRKLGFIQISGRSLRNTSRRISHFKAIDSCR